MRSRRIPFKKSSIKTCSFGSKCDFAAILAFVLVLFYVGTQFDISREKRSNMNLLKDKVLLRNLLFQGDQLNTISGGVAQITMKVEQQTDGFLINIHAPGVSPDHLKVISDNQSMQIFATLDMKNADNIPAIMPIFYRKLDLPSFVNTEAVEAVHYENNLEVFVPLGANNSGDRRQIEIKQI